MHPSTPSGRGPATRAVAALRALRGRVRALPYMGTRYTCPCCGGRFRRLAPHGVPPRQNARCPRCNALERHRLLWLYLSAQTDLFTARRRVLHVAPEYPLQRALARAPNIDYVSADIQSPLAMVKLDVENIPYPDGSFDVVLCNHVLEHVPDDRRAMRELFRVLSPGGFAILLTPLDASRAATLEDPAIVDPKDRERVFGQWDHVRLYGRDFTDRLREAGFSVEVIPFQATLDPALVERHALFSAEDIFVGRKPR